MYGSVHEELFQWWQRSDAKQNQLVLLPRDHQKSHCIAVRVAWWITKNPETTVLYVSATSDLAEKQLKAIKDILTSKVYTRYWPEMVHPQEGKREAWNNSEISVDHPKRKLEGVRDPTIKAAGLTTNITGFHCNVSVLDDVIVPSNAYTGEGRNKVASMYSQLASIQTTDAVEWVVGTRYHPKDLYDTLIQMEEEIYDEGGDLVSTAKVYEVFQKVVEEGGEFLWPKQRRRDGKYFGFDIAALARKKAKYVDRTQFYAQYYNDPNDPGNMKIAYEKFQYYDPAHLKQKDGNWFLKDRMINIFASMDFSFSIAKKADYSALVVIGMDSDRFIYVLDIIRFKTKEIGVMFDNVLRAHQKWEFKRLTAETSVAQVAVVNEFRVYMRKFGVFFILDEHKPTSHDGKKEERMDAELLPKYDNGTIWHYKGGNCQALEEELVLQHPEHDDIKDALSVAVSKAMPPSRKHSRHTRNKVVYDSRFGGVSFG